MSSESEALAGCLVVSVGAVFAIVWGVFLPTVGLLYMLGYLKGGG